MRSITDIKSSAPREDRRDTRSSNTRAAENAGAIVHAIADLCERIDVLITLERVKRSDRASRWWRRR